MRGSWLLSLPRLLSGLITVALGAYVMRTYALIGLVMLLVGSVSLVLAARSVIAARSAARENGDQLGKSEFDYLVWISLGVPMILAILIVVIAIATR